MKTILCYGDSNTWGWDPKTQERFPRDVRWTGRLQMLLGCEYYVIEEGLSGRTTVWDDPIEEHKNGKTYLYPCLESHKPLDLVVLMLGTNDLKKRFSLSAFDVAVGVERLIDIIQKSGSSGTGGAPFILLLSPPLIGELDGVGEEIFEGARPKVPQLKEYLLQISHKYNCAFLDPTSFLKVSRTEGLHLDGSAHDVLSFHVAQAVKEIFDPSFSNK